MITSKKLFYYSRVPAVLALLLSFAAACGWCLHIRSLVQILPDLAAMQFNTAVCLMLLSLSLLVPLERSAMRSYLLLPVLLFAIANIIQLVFSVNLGIDELFIKHFIQVKTAHPGRMAPNTALAILLSGLAIMLLSQQKVSRTLFLTSFLFTGMTVIFGMSALIGYLVGTEISYGWGNVTLMALNTAFGLVLLGLSISVQLVSLAIDQEIPLISFAPCILGLCITIFGVYLWQGLNRAQHLSIQRNTQLAVNSAKDRLETRLSEVTRALRRMVVRLDYGMSIPAWRDDALYYAADFPSYKGIFLTDEEGTIVEDAEVIQQTPDSQNLIRFAWNKLHRWGEEGAALSDLMTYAGNRRLFLISLPLQSSSKGRYLVVLVDASDFFGQILQQSFVAPGYSLAGSAAQNEFVSRIAKESNLRKSWSRAVTLNFVGSDWILEAWPTQELVDQQLSPLPLVALVSTVIFGLLIMLFLHFADNSRQARTLAEEATEAKSNFLANMSHEIRTPLTAIIGFTETLLEDSLPEDETREALLTVSRSSSHLLRLINDILDLSKIEAKKLDIEITRFSLVDVLSDIANFMLAQANSKGLSFGFEYVYPIPQYISTDVLRLKQILINLIGNAIKFTQTGGVKVVVVYSADRGILTFKVIDTGIGISEEQKGKLFQAFSQADASTTRKFGGTGLGLLISSQLAEMLGGKVEVESHLGRGSTVSVSINVGEVSSGELLYTIEDIKEKSASSTPLPVRRISGQVLVAEDGLDNQRYISLLLDKLGVQVTIVNNGKSALEQVQERSFDLILMDMQMPVMDGYTAIKELKDGGCTIPILALTANAMAADRERCQQAGATDFLGKPFTRQEFFDKVTGLLGCTSDEDGPAQSIEELFGDEVLFQQLIKDFEFRLKQRHGALLDALHQQDYLQVGALAHQLRGSGGFFGHEALSELCGRIETAAASRREELASLLGELDAYIASIHG